ncbi:MAG TPA: HAMP domain-containing sensor histidine kinase [Streptosporangiaceae bacterium]|nr:HAMP domain-containing sensor histidine kinase [Streptosporangiaceae bacterium]
MKLITAVLALVAVALVVISVAGVSFLRSYLLGQADSQLASLADQVQSFQRLPTGRFGPEPFAVEFVTGGKADIVGGYLPQGNTGPLINPSASWLRGSNPVTVGAAAGPDRWRVIALPDTSVNGSQPGTLVIGVDVTSQYATLGRLIAVDLIVSVVLLLGVAVVGIGVVRASLRPLTEIEKTAGAIAAGDLSRRVPDRDPRTEVGRLGRSLNVMLSQIESAFQSQSRSEAAARRSEERMRQFVADASHELRTPLTAIRGFAEYYRQRGGIAGGNPLAGSADAGQAAPGDVAATAGSGPGARQLAPTDMNRIMRRVEQESARMGILVEDMLLLARLDQQRPLTASPVDLLTLAADAVHDARVVAPARSINLTVSSGTALLVIGDEVRLRQVIGNLMSNALTHTPDGTPIDVLIRSGNVAEATAATAVARPDVAEPSFGDEPAGSDEAPADDELAMDDEPDTGNEPAIESRPSTGNWATAAGMHWDAEHVPPPPEASAPGSPSGRLPAERAQGAPAAVLEVTDHGPGLTSEQAGHVFERFYRADPARTTGGTGLGLAIVAALVAAHGGTAWVRSRPGDGATFCIALPLSPEAMQGPENDFDGDAGDVTTETGATETGASETGPADDGTGRPGAAFTATAKAD